MTHNYTRLPPTVDADAITIPRHTAQNLIAFAETLTDDDTLRVFGQKPLPIDTIHWVNNTPHVIIAFTDLSSYRGLQLRFAVTDTDGYGGVLRWTGERDTAATARVEHEVIREYSVEARVTGAHQTHRPSAATATISIDTTNTSPIGHP